MMMLRRADSAFRELKNTLPALLLFLLSYSACAEVTNYTIDSTVHQPGSTPLKNFFGVDVQKCGDLAIVGAFGESTNGLQAGAAFIYRREGDTGWVYEATLLADDGDDRDRMGLSVGLYENRAIVGAFFDEDAAARAGSAYVFERDSATQTWRQTQKLLASDAGKGYQFGAAVDIWKDTIVVGSYWHNKNPQTKKTGALYVFSYDSASSLWTETARVIPGDVATKDNFGVSVAIHEDTIIAGSSNDDDNGVDSGSAYVFVRDGTSWTQQAKLLSFDGSADDSFGFSVAVSENTAVVGAHFHRNKEGAAYIFTRDGAGIWTQTARLQPNEVKGGEEFGRDVALTDDVIVVGAHFDNAIYVFERNEDGIWMNQHQRKIQGSTTGSYYGFAVDVEGSDIAVGAYLEPRSGVEAGSVYFYSPEKESYVIGDPHLQAWSGRRFEFMGICDLVMVHSERFAHGRGLDIHIRTSEIKHTSYISTAVVKIGDDKLEVYEDGSYRWNGELNVDLPPTFAGGFTMYHTVIDGWLPVWEISSPTGSRIYIQVFAVMVDVKLFGFKSNEVIDSLGLMGGFVSGELLDRVGGQMEDIDTFGQEWQARETDGLLFSEIREPQYPTKCTMVDAEARRRNLESSSISKEEAQSICSQVSSQLLDACVHDVLVTENPEVSWSYIYFGDHR